MRITRISTPLRSSVTVLCVLALALAGFSAPGPGVSDLPVTGDALLRQWKPPVYPPDALKERVGGLVLIRMVVDEKGAVASAHVLDSSDDRLAAEALAAAKEWVFSPALDNGHPVAMSMDAPVEFSPDSARKKPGFLPPADQTPQPSPKTPARPNESYNAEYPDSLLDRRLSGIVRFTCIVTPDGRATSIRVIAASHSDFVIPALQSLDHWTFVPGTQGDLPSQSELQGDVSFDTSGTRPEDVLAANHITAPDGNPPPAQPVLRIVADPVRPFDMLMAGEGGSATVSYTVDKEGRPKDVQVQSATKPEFGAALVAAVESSYYGSGAIDGHSVETPLIQRVDFKAITPENKEGTDPDARVVEALRAKQISGPQGLDEKLTPLYRVGPQYPGSLRAAGRPAGKAEIEFVIDKDGRARIPRVISATSAEFGWSAATAVAQWVFKAPRRNGQPSEVKVRIPFDFKSPAT